MHKVIVDSNSYVMVIGFAIYFYYSLENSVEGLKNRALEQHRNEITKSAEATDEKKEIELHKQY